MSDEKQYIEVALDYGSRVEQRRVEVKDGVATVPVIDARFLSGEPLWAKVEQNGHRTFSGRVSDVMRAGVTFLQIDIPGREDPVIIGPTTIFALSPCKEMAARRLAPRSTETITQWDLRGPTQRALGPSHDDADDAEFENETDHDALDDDDPGF